MPSRTPKSRDASSSPADQYRANGAAAASGQPAPSPFAVGGSGVTGNGSAGGAPAAIAPELDSPPDGAGSPPLAASPSSGRMLRNWRVRSRLVLLIAIPTATAVALGGVSIVSSWQSAVADQRTEVLASTSRDVTNLAFQIEAERDSVIWYIAVGRLSQSESKPAKATSSDQLSFARQEIGYTGPLLSTVAADMGKIGSAYPQVVQQDAHAVRSVLNSLPALRTQALTQQVAAADVVTEYDNDVSVLLAFDDQVALSSNDPQLTSTARALGTISRYEDEESVQRAIIMYGVTAPGLSSKLISELTASIADEDADYAQFQNFATTTQITKFQSLSDASLNSRVQADESSVIANPAGISKAAIVNTDWWGAMTNAIQATHTFEEYLVSSVVARAQALRQRAIISSIIVGAVILLVLIIALLFTVWVGRSMVRPLRRLRAGALEVAGVKLPETVRRMNEADGENVPVEVEPIDVESSDEIGEVARAFDQVHREALRLAATEAALRGNVNAMFVNLSRRSQSLVERQIRLIDELEQGEQDADRLASLFQMDHLATRMRRNSENLLVLAGHESSRRWNQPVPLVDVLRAAISEIEQYERVMLNVQPGIAVRGPAVNDVVHLIAELAENATSFSSADTPVSVSGHLLGSGGVLLDITDEGVGMGTDEMAHANWRLDNPPVVDVAVSRRMGLFVVARLAARHGIRVRLRSATGNGLTALVWLPDEVIVHEGAHGAADPGNRLTERPPRVAIAPGSFNGSSNGSGADSWSPEGPPSAFDEVAAARARFTPLQPTGSDAFGSAGIGPSEISQPGVGEPVFGQSASLTGPGLTGPGLTGPGLTDPGLTDPGQRGFGAREFGAAAFADDGAAAQGFGSDRSRGERGSDRGAQDGERRSVTDTGSFSLGPPRIPGAGPHPGRYATGPIPRIDTGPRPGADHPEWFAAAGGAGNSGQGATLGPVGQGAGGSGPGTGPIPAISDPVQWPDQGQSTGPLTGGPGWAVGRGQGQAPPGSRVPEQQSWEQDQADSRSQPVFGAPVARTMPANGAFRTQDQFGTTPGGVIVPPPSATGEENRLPIFEAVESDWFRRGRPSVEWPAESPGSGTDTGTVPQPVTVPAAAWSTPVDEGWRAAEVAVAPASGGTTVAGLPRRVPQANLIPGAATAEAPPPVPARSAAATRERFASLQRGMREGRAATGIDRPQGTGEVPGDG